MRAHLQMLHFRLHALIYFLWRHGCGWGGRGSGQAAYSGVKLDQSQDVPNCSRNLQNRRVKPSHVKTSRTITTEFTTLPSRIIGQTPVISICSLAQKEHGGTGGTIVEASRDSLQHLVEILHYRRQIRITDDEFIM